MLENILKSGNSQHDYHAAMHSHYGNIHNENVSLAIMSCFRGFHALAGNKKKFAFIVRMIMRIWKRDENAFNNQSPLCFCKGGKISLNFLKIHN